MFKSVFAKYITVFMVLIVVSFAMLLAIISTVVNNYSVNAKADLVAQSAHTASAWAAYAKTILHIWRISSVKS